MFTNCINLTGSIPEDLFKNCSKISDFRYTFSGCTGLTGKIPAKLFENCTDVSGQSFQATFYKCSGLTGEIPAELFATNTKASSFYMCFQDCTGLTGAIPAKLFENNTKASNFAYTFWGCIGLTGEIPQGLLKNNTEVTSVNWMFHRCTGITGKIPEGLFSNCSKLTNVQAVFANTSITEIPANLFDVNNGEPNGIKIMNGAFGGTKITTVPAGLFDLCTEVTLFGTSSTQPDGIFRNCTLLETIPDKLFYNNDKVTCYGGVFWGCTNLKSIPENTFSPNLGVYGNVYMGAAFRDCKALTEIKSGVFENITNITDMWNMFLGCSNLETIEGGFIIPETVTNIKATFAGCSKLVTTITLKSNQAAYQKNTFDAVNTNTRLNWAAPCTREIVEEMLTSSNRMDIIGTDVTE